VSGLTQVFATANDVPGPPSDELLISSFTIIYLVMHKVDPVATAAAWADKRIRPSSSPDAYQARVRPGSHIHYSNLLPGGRLNAHEKGLLGIVDDGQIYQSVVWLGGAFLLSAVVVKASVDWTGASNACRLLGPVDVDQLLSFIAYVADPLANGVVVERCTESLEWLSIINPGESTLTYPSIGIQLWSLEGTPTRLPASPYDYLVDSRLYSWELSALLSYTSDHVRDGLWRRRSRNQVFEQAHEGFSFLEDHMVYLTDSCCLEITNLQGWLRDRSRNRLAEFGYDSSSMFIWIIGILKSIAIAEMAHTYNRELSRLIESQSISNAEFAEVVREESKLLVVIDTMSSLSSLFLEARNRAVWNRLGYLRGDDHRFEALSRDMRRVSDLASRLAKVRDEQNEERLSKVVGLVGAIVAVASLPLTIAQCAVWIGGHNWVPLGISLALTVAVMILLAGSVKRRS